jgi:hypothetical protein
MLDEADTGQRTPIATAALTLLGADLCEGLANERDSTS